MWPPRAVSEVRKGRILCLPYKLKKIAVISDYALVRFDFHNNTFGFYHAHYYMKWHFMYTYILQYFK